MIYFSDFGVASTPLRSIEPVQVALRTSTGTQDITLPGFGSCSGAILLMAINTADEDYSFSNGGIGLSVSHGATDGTNSFAIAVAGYSNQRVETGAIAGLINGSKAWTTRVAFDSFITNGIRVNVTVSDGIAHRLTVFLISSVLPCKVGTYAAASGTQTQTVGFTPSLIHTFHATGNLNSTSGFATFSRGLYCSGGQVSYGVTNGTPGGTGETRGLLRSDRAYVGPNQDNATISNVGATTFDITHTAAASGSGWVAIGGLSNTWVGVMDAPTATGSQNVTNGAVGFTPTMAFVLPTNLLSSNTYVSNLTASSVGYGMATAAGQRSVATSAQDDSINLRNGTTNSGRLVHLRNHEGSIANQSTLTSFISNGMQMNVEYATASAQKWLVAFAR